MVVNVPALVTLVILTVAIILLLFNITRPDLIALLVLVSLGLTSVITPSEMFSGFSRSAVITVMALFIMTNALYRTGVTRWMGERLLQLGGRRPWRLTLTVMLAGAVLSYFMNTIAAGAVLLPAIIGLARTADIRPSKLLIPLSYGTLLGGMATLLTTSSILINAALRDAGHQPFQLLDFLPVGGALSGAGILFMIVLGRRWLPNRSPLDRYGWDARYQSALSDLYSLQERLYDAQIEPTSPLIGQSIAASRIGETLGLSILAIERRRQTILAPGPDEVLRAKDVLIIVGRSERVEQLIELGVAIEVESDWEDDFSSEYIGMAEVIIAPRSRVVGQTLKEINFRQKFGLTVIALWRNGRSYRTDVGELPLEFGDALLMHGPREKMRLLQAEPDFLVLQPETGEAQRPAKAWLAAAIMLGTLCVMAVGWLPIAEATFTGAILLVVTKCLTMDEAYQAIEWRAIFLIAGMLPLGLALTKTGAATWLGQVLIQTFGGFGPLSLLAVFYLAAMLLTQFVSGQAAAVIVAPIALSAALQLNASPYAFAMAAALACSTAFLTPIAHPVNLLIMGPGGYTSRDFFKVGLPLTLVVFVVMLIVLPRIWPL
ncbi:Sodium-dependent dicarboxylate transporter SdcS [Thermoflexales bacterium]|nr:Sodium-dependent dicarboxylate transporter SdcS [Thermoflexales bacterium]